MGHSEWKCYVCKCRELDYRGKWNHNGSTMSGRVGPQVKASLSPKTHTSVINLTGIGSLEFIKGQKARLLKFL